MTKTQALAEFREHIYPIVVKQYGKDDKPAMSQAWNDYTDSLCKDRRITAKQYSTWDNPF